MLLITIKVTIAQCMPCHIHNCCTNHMCYADDLYVIAPSPSALQGLMKICAKFGSENDVEYNPIKSLCMSNMSNKQNI